MYRTKKNIEIRNGRKIFSPLFSFPSFISFLSLFSFISFQCIAQNDTKWEFKINGGYNIGGTSPLPLPEEIREIKKFSLPAFAPHLAFETTRWFNEKWGLTTQLTLDYKGFSVSDSVLNLHTEMEIDKGSRKSGNFTGTNSTKIKNAYFTVPVMVSYQISDKWLVQAGTYFAYLFSPSFTGSASDGYFREGSPIGEKTEIDKTNFDFSDNLRKFDFGLQAAGEWYFKKNLAIRAQLAWGLTPIFPSDFTAISFDMYNIYGTIGIAYILK